MPLPVVLSMSPPKVVEDVYKNVSDTMAAHQLRYASRSQETLLDEIGAADYVLGDWSAELKLDRTALEAARRAKVVVHPTAGYDSIDVAAAQELGLPVANRPGANASGVAEWAAMAALVSMKNVIPNHERLREGEWRMVEAPFEGVYEIKDRCLGVVGFGAIGQGVAKRLAGFGLSEILYFDLFVNVEEIEGGIAVQRVETMDELFERSDVVSLHLPLTAETRNLVSQEKLEKLGPDGVLINTARGGVVDEQALYDALASRKIKAAALDVFSQEPLTGPHQWADLDNVLLSPHLAGSTLESIERMISGSLAAIDGAISGVLPDTVVNGVDTLR